MEEMVSNSSYSRHMLERRERPQKEQHLNCPRCSSIHTKFCYYNNYSLTQPRYFCKTCRRYWTQGGSLRNVPVGGSSRKNKRSLTSPPSSSAAASTSSKKIPDLTPPSYSSHNNPNINTENNNKYPSSSSTSSLELLRTGITSMGLSLSSLTQMPTQGTNTDYPLGFGLQGFKPNIDFGVHKIGGGGYSNLQGVQGSDKKLLFPFEDLRQVSSTTDHHFEQNRGQQGDSTGYWVGMLGGSSC